LQGYNRQRMQRMTCEILNREEVVVENSGEWEKGGWTQDDKLGTLEYWQDMTSHVPGRMS
jgi:hypothetical protein